MLHKIKDIPTLSQVTIDLIGHAFQDEPDLQALASIIKRDPTLTAKLFKTVNSAAFGLRVEVTSIQQAVSIMGLEALRATIVSISLGDYFISQSFGKRLDAKNFCIHSLATGVIMDELARFFDLKERCELYLIGLLHDMGKLVLDSLPGCDYIDVLERVNAGKTFEKAEREVYGIDNRQTWRVLARTWAFPQAVVDIYNGSLNGRLNRTTWSFTEEASRVAESLGYGFIPIQNPDDKNSFDILNLLEDNQIAEIGLATQRQVEALGRTLELPAPDRTETFKILYRTARNLSMANAQFQKTHSELVYRVEVLQELTRVFSGIIKSLHGESLAISVLEALIEGFHVNGAFLFNTDRPGAFKGYTARIGSRGDPGFHLVDLGKGQAPDALERSRESTSPLRVDSDHELEQLREYLGDVNLAWLTPVSVRGRCASILGLGIRDGNLSKFRNEEFGSILHIVAGEIALSMENTRLYNRVKREASTDALTAIYNRRTIMKVLNSEFARFKRHRVPLSMALFDLDNFKSINDVRGHLVGDEFLIRAARILQEGIRESDHVGRFGGDEFIAVFPDTKPEDTAMVVERILESMRAYCREFQGGDIHKPLSVSIGVAGASDKMNRADELIQLADNALYEAKNGGRNHCIIYREHPEPQKTTR